MSGVSAGATATRGEPLVLPRRVVINGTLTFDGEIHLAGKVEGDVTCKTLQISERGLVEGDIVAERVVVLGEVVGTIQAAVIELKAACHVQGQIFHQKLVLEDGCWFEGQSRRGFAPRLVWDSVDAASAS